MLLGCIGDDFTGSSDLANMLRRGGMTVVQYVGVPNAPAGAEEAAVVALKSRTIPVRQAVAQSLEAAEWLIAQGAEQIYFKYCSTFDSTPEGNIGPVLDALMERLGARGVPVVPSFPETGRSVYQGHLFVGDRLLSDTGMKNHPLTPMTDSDIRRWLGHQTVHPVGLVPAGVVQAGAEAVGAALDQHPVAVVDTVSDADLHVIGAACAGRPLVSGGSGLALGLPQNFAGRLAGESAQAWQGAPGPGVVLSGSCSEATREQVTRYAAENPSLKLDPDGVMEGRVTVTSLTEFAKANPDALIYATDTPEAVKAAQERHGTERLATAIEALFTELTRTLTGAGFTRIVSAGGETSGAVVAGLSATALEVGPQIAPGVPALKVRGRDVALALKSGNFGGPDFFAEALAVLGGADD